MNQKKDKKPCKDLAYQYAIRLLSKQNYSKYKLKQKLLKRDYEEKLIDELIITLIEKKYLREDYYIEARIRGMMVKGYSVSYIHLKLEEEFIDVDESKILTIFKEYQVSEEEQVAMLVHKKSVNIPQNTRLEFKDKVKILRFLASKGHSADKVEQCLASRFN